MTLLKFCYFILHSASPIHYYYFLVVEFLPNFGIHQPGLLEGKLLLLLSSLVLVEWGHKVGLALVEKLYFLFHFQLLLAFILLAVTEELQIFLQVHIPALFGAFRLLGAFARLVDIVVGFVN